MVTASDGRRKASDVERTDDMRYQSGLTGSDEMVLADGASGGQCDAAHKLRAGTEHASVGHQTLDVRCAERKLRVELAPVVGNLRLRR